MPWLEKASLGSGVWKGKRGYVQRGFSVVSVCRILWNYRRFLYMLWSRPASEPGQTVTLMMKLL